MDKIKKSETPIAYLRSLSKTTQCELTFWLKITHPKYGVLDQEIKSLRQINDNVASLLTHTENKIIKLYQDNSQTEIDGNELRKNMSMSLSRNDQEFPTTTTCTQLIELRRKIRFKIFDVCYCVIINAPLIQELTLPPCMYVNAYAKIQRLKGIHLSKGLSKYQWSKSKEKENWEIVFYELDYLIQKEDLHHYLKLTCTPLSNDGTKGPIVEVISENVVEILPEAPSTSLIYREQFVGNKLTGKSIRVVSYNTLAERYTEDNQFFYCDPMYLSMDYRKHLICKELMSYKADIICLQEVDHHHYHSFFKTHFKNNGYASFFYKKGHIIHEGLSFIFDRNRFKKLDVRHIVLALEVKKKMYQNIWKLIKNDTSVRELFMKQHTSLLVATLKSIETNDIYIVANTHLYYHKEAGHIRVLQIAIALKFIKQQYQNIKNTESGNVSVIFCGDFNSRPDTAVYHFLTEGDLRNWQGDLDNIGGSKCNVYQHDFNFVSACGIPKYTNYTEDFKGCLDYIMCQKSAKILQVLPFPSEEELAKEVALPNKSFPSDHIALVADLMF